MAPFELIDLNLRSQLNKLGRQLEIRMAWNEPGGGKRDDKERPRDPWGSGNENNPPDFDEVMRKVKQSLGGLFGGGGSKDSGTGGGSSANIGGILMLIGGLLAVWLVIDSIHILDERQRGVVLRFGEFNRELQPGLQFAFPRPIESVHRVDVLQVRSTNAEVRMLTEDENIVNLEFSVQYQIDSARDFLFKVRDPEITLHQAAESAIRQVVGSNQMDFALSGGRTQIAADSRIILQDLLDRYGTGIAVVGVQFEDVRPPMQVKEAFDDAIIAREDRARIENEAQAYASQQIPEARGRAARVLEEAAAYRAERIARADGESQRFSLLLDEFEMAPEVTRKRLYLETMEQVLAITPKVLLDVESGSNMLYLPLDNMRSGGDGSRDSRQPPRPPPLTSSASSDGRSDPRARPSAGSTRPTRENR